MTRAQDGRAEFRLDWMYTILALILNFKMQRMQKLDVVAKIHCHFGSVVALKLRKNIKMRWHQMKNWTV